MNAQTFEWTEENETRLREMWHDGKTTGQIAPILGCSKSAVCGKVRRLDLPRRTSRSTPHVPKVPEPRREGKQNWESSAPGLRELKLTEFEMKCVTFDELKPRHCRWPAGDGQFCGNDRKSGSSYCAGHHERSIDARATARAKKKSRKAVRQSSQSKVFGGALG